MGLKVAVAGVAGRMGRQIVGAALEAGLALTGGSERPERAGVDLGLLAGREAIGLLSVDAPARAAEGADVWIDFSAPAATLDALVALRATSVRAVIIGTTGFSPEEESVVQAFAERYAIVKAGNFSLGVHMLAGLVRLAARQLPAGEWDIEILEAHHRHKRDAPSGTAILLAEAAAQGREVSLIEARRLPDWGETGPRPEGSIGFAVRRGGGLVGEHEAMFAAARETIRLSHTALDRRVFADGAIAAARWAAGRTPGYYGMGDVLGLD